MASEVEICNLALAHLGDSATVASLDPPEGSAQAEHCQRFYPIARDAVLEMHDWNFATRRAELAAVTFGFEQWAYAYALPSDCLRALAVLSPSAADDYSYPVPSVFTQDQVPNAGQGIYTPQQFTVEINDSGDQILLTNVEDAILRYTAMVEDTTKFSPLFTITLSWHLASMLAGPVVKGEAGRAEAKRCAEMAQFYLSRATRSDASQRKVNPTHSVSWMAGR